MIQRPWDIQLEVAGFRAAYEPLTPRAFRWLWDHPDLVSVAQPYTEYAEDGPEQRIDPLLVQALEDGLTVGCGDTPVTMMPPPADCEHMR